MVDATKTTDGRSPLRKRIAGALLLGLLTITLVTGISHRAAADPCGMVPPITIRLGQPITRVGRQITYVFYKDGIETIVLRPGFSGKVDQFGMLIPFPTPPALRKVSDQIFPQIAAAADPPEVVFNLRAFRQWNMPVADGASLGGAQKLGLRRDMPKDQVRVIREEAVGMYEVVVLDAGSAVALKRWMDDHQFRYPRGMDAACDDYIADGWCFVAVKTRVGRKRSADPRPGQKKVDPVLPPDFSFDGHVQAMGFRFRTPRMVVPMRLSTFNKGKLHNVVYALTDKPVRINHIPREFVVRQIPGKILHRNVTGPLPLRVIGGSPKAVPKNQYQVLRARRDPQSHNGAGRDLFGSDLLTVRTGRMSHPFEERHKELLRISERLRLRGAEIDKWMEAELQSERKRVAEKALNDLKSLTLTVIDGEFPREVLATDNLTFSEYAMPRERNTPQVYNCRLFGPDRGTVTGTVTHEQLGARPPRTPTIGSMTGPNRRRWKLALYSSLGGVALAWLLIAWSTRRRTPPSGKPLALLLLACATVPLAAPLLAESPAPDPPAEDVRQIVQKLGQAHDLEAAVRDLRRVPDAAFQLDRFVRRERETVRRGWAVLCLAELNTGAARKTLKDLAPAVAGNRLLSAWVAAARVRTATDIRQLQSIVQSTPAIVAPSLKRGLGVRIGELVQDQAGDVDLRELVQLSLRYPALDALAVRLGQKRLADLMRTMLVDSDMRVRRKSASLLGAAALEDKPPVHRELLRALRWTAGAKAPPWKNGALFLPSMRRTRTETLEVAERLLQWWLGLSKPGGPKQHRVINNNLRALATQLRGSTPGGHDLPSWLRWYRAYAGDRAADRLRKPFTGTPSLPKTAPVSAKKIVEGSLAATRRASLNGKYRGLLHILPAKHERSSYGELYDYGLWTGTSHNGVNNLSPGYWVYCYPNWYIWRERVAKQTKK